MEFFLAVDQYFSKRAPSLFLNSLLYFNLMVFKNRQEAGKKLATKLLSHLVIEPLSNKQSLLLRNKIIVLAIPRGGVVVGKELASFLDCPLEVIVTKKIGAPGNPELAVGAVEIGRAHV